MILKRNKKKIGAVHNSALKAPNSYCDVKKALENTFNAQILL